MRNSWDSTGNQQVKNGNGTFTSWHRNGRIAEEGQFLEGYKQGYWYGYHDNGKPFFRESYQDNRLIKGEAITEDGTKYTYDQTSLYPSPSIGFDEYMTYLASAMGETGEVYPAKGVVKLSFTVDPDESLRDFVVLKSVCTACDQEAIRLVKEGPAWQPALWKGHQKISSKAYVDVTF